MALDLFVNFERASNHPMFYRVVSSTPYTVTIKLSDLMVPNGDLSTYYVEYTFNNIGPGIQWKPDENGFFVMTPAPFNISYPCVSSIQVYVSGADLYALTGATSGYLPAGVFELSAKIVPNFPSINFIAYPSLYVDVANAINYQTITSQNYKTVSPGVQFYGEGHTEVINLSSNNYTNSNNKMIWFVGNTITDLLTGSIASFMDPASSLSSCLVVQSNTSTATVSVTSEVGKYPKHPISLWATNSYITKNGPITTYRDLDGKFGYYPFFTSSLSADNITDVSQQAKSSIKVLPYPETKDVVVTKFPFKEEGFYLPFDYSSLSFTTVTDMKNIVGDAFNETFAGTKWQIEGVSRAGDWLTETSFLSSIYAYKFKLMYERDTAATALLPFKAAAIYPTTINVNLTSYRDCVLSLPSKQGEPSPPQDWGHKLVPVTNTLSATINPIPFDKVYTPNYFNVKGQDVSFAIISTPEPPYTIEQLTLQSESSKETLVLTNTSLTGTMKFDTIGIVDLSATAVLKNNISNSTTNVSLIYQDLIEIVKNLDDDTEEQYFHTIYTPLNLTYPTLPRLSPNEWAIADNVNSIIEKLYTTTEELLYRGRTYNQKNKWYGYLEPAEKVSVMKIPGQYDGFQAPRVWLDLDCTTGDVTDETASWDVFSTTFSDVTATWEWNNCTTRVKIDPSCFQKYCVQWNWRWREKGATDVDITWKDTQSKNVFKKKWKWETCSIDAVNINCDRAKWNVSTIDSELFPFPIDTITDRCTIVDCDVNLQTDQIVLAHRTELHLVDKDYYCNHTARTGMLDDLFSFYNIVGLATTSQGKVAVLDSAVPRVSVYSIDRNNFTPFSTWGSYGLKQTPQGMRDPLDIHVDKYDYVWIADTGNKCIKKFTLIGKPLMTISHEDFEEYPPLSICVDSQDNVHCLTSKNVIVFNKEGSFNYQYEFDKNVDGPVSKINISYNKEIVYITYQYGISKHFRNGTFFGYVLKDVVCQNGSYFQGYNSVAQDKFRNVYITAGDKILQVADLQQITNLRANIPSDLYWNLDELFVHKEEYIQPWVYLKSFHRLWDNIELIRNSIFYVPDSNCKSFKPPTFQKEDLIIGQNEIVTNAVINRLSEQLWTNLQSIIDYFNPDCEN